jgi:hypothetical protein
MCNGEMCVSVYLLLGSLSLLSIALFSLSLSHSSVEVSRPPPLFSTHQPSHLAVAVAAEVFQWPPLQQLLTQEPGLEAAFQATCEAVAGLGVAVLDEKQPE